MKILYLGDIMGEAGIQVVQDLLPDLIDEHEIDVVIAQSENVSDGKSMTIRDMKRLQLSGVDVFSGGNHSVERKELYPLLKDDASPVLAPANMAANPGSGVYLFEHLHGTVAVISMLGTMFMAKPIKMENPFVMIEKLLSDLPAQPAAVVVNIHAEFSSEKVLMGYQLDGRVTAVIGDHWHVPTADARILPKGTAHITDVGMCGALNGSIGAEVEGLLQAVTTDGPIKAKIEMNGPRQLCGVIVETKPKKLTANKITQILSKTKA